MNLVRAGASIGRGSLGAHAVNPLSHAKDGKAGISHRELLQQWSII